eukprot:jgi/Bigna1/48995/estExt_Genewise1.C_370062
MASTVDADRIQEIQEQSSSQEAKIKTLANWVRKSKYTVFYTGAGVSTSAGIGDYRGPTGAWTMKSEKKGKQKSVPMIDARPTPTHMAMSTLIRKKIAHYIVTTNLDGIHRKSGLKAHTQICNLHGSVYAERCTGCGYDFERNYYTRRSRIHVHDHHIGQCQRDNHLIGTRDERVGTKDTHINFGECLDDMDWNEADKHCRKADLVIVAGTSMSLRHITHFPFLAKRTVIINLQQTPDDRKCDLRIWGKTDPVFEALMEQLGISIDPVPVWIPRDSVPIHKIPKYVSSYYVQAAKRLEDSNKKLKAEAKARQEAVEEAAKKKRKEAQQTTEEKAAIAILKSGIRFGNTVSRAGNSNFKWTLFLKSAAGEAKLNQVADKVTYFLHPTFSPNKVTVSAAESKNFELSRIGWGTFEITAQIHWKPSLNLRPILVSHNLDFNLESGIATTIIKSPKLTSRDVVSRNSSPAESHVEAVGCCG